MKKFLPLIIIFTIGVLLRFVSLGTVPPVLLRDEAFLGYNAFSILKTGRDMSGNFLPLHLKSFLYSPAGYSYVSIPFIWAFGLSAFSVRFASALYGSLTIILVYMVVVDMCSLFGHIYKSRRKSEIVALLSAAALALSPWHINLSRTATENTTVTFFILLGVLLFLRFIKKQNVVFLLLSYASFFVTLFIYQSPRAFLPVFIPFLVFMFRKSLTTFYKGILIVFYCILIVVPVILVLRSPDLSTRIRTLNIFQFPRTQIMVNDWISTDGVMHVPYILTRVFHNKITGYALTYTENFADYFSYGFLFSDKGLPARYKIPSTGLLYPYEIIFIFISLVYLFNTMPATGMLLVGWILISFSGAALTFDDIPNLQRTLMAAPVFSILSGLGMYVLYEILKTRKARIAGVAIGLVMLYSVGFYLMQYYSYGRNYQPWNKQDGYRELVFQVNLRLKNHAKAVVTTREGSPTIFFLFYSRYDPKSFQNETKNVDTAASDHISFGDYLFSTEECPLRDDLVTGRLTGEQGILYVNSDLCGILPHGTHMLDEIHRVDGTKVFQLATVD